MTLALPPHLQRYPVRKNELLQAWDAADELIVNHLAKNFASLPQPLLILHDHFGALSTAVSTSWGAASDASDLVVYTDSYVSYRATLANTHEKIRPLNLMGTWPGTFALALLRVPKNLAFFEDMLAHLSSHLLPGPTSSSELW